MKYKQIPVHPTRIPIEFKRLSPKDFSPDYIVVNNTIGELEPDESGYIGNSLMEKISLEEKNTVIINTGVGTGKSTACINIAKSYLEQYDNNGKPKYVVVFVAPFISLINQYHKKLVEAGIEPRIIFNYLRLNTGNIKIAANAKVHLITINTLIGNYGDDSFFQSRDRRSYVDEIITQCEKKGKKVVFIFDEIHDSIQNFQQRFIFNLWKWKYVVHKSFVLSATFTESSKVVIKYLADLTDDKIQLLESKRVKQKEGLSNLHLCFLNNFSYSAEDEEIASFIETELDKGKKVHILTFSEKLANEIATPKKQKGAATKHSLLGKLLLNNTPGINLCTSKTKASFNENKCNVGTTFKTGISMEGGNISLFIIAPPKSSYPDKYFGIFSDGTTPIIQAVARLRNGDNNDIFIITPSPSLLIKNPTNYSGVDNYLTRVSRIPSLRNVKIQNRREDYYSTEEQFGILNKYMSATLTIARKGIENHNHQTVFIKNRSKTKPRLDFPTLDEFIITDGDRFLASEYSIYGANPAAYIVWASYNNQFVNCTLKSIYEEEPLTLKEGEIVNKLIEIFKEKYEHPRNIDDVSEKELFDSFYKFITETLNIKVRLRDSAKPVPSIKSPLIKKGVISVIQYFKRANTEFNNLLYPNRTGKAIDFFIDKRTYVYSQIANATGFLVQYQNQLDGTEKVMTNNYQKLKAGIEAIKNSVLFSDGSGVKYFPQKRFIIANNIFDRQFILKFLGLLKSIRSHDFFIKDDTFSLCQFIDKYSNQELEKNDRLRNQAFGKLIDEIRETFFDTERTNISARRGYTNNTGISILGLSSPYRIRNDVNFEKWSGYVNLTYTSNCPWNESTVSEDFLIRLNEAQKNHPPEAIL